MKETLLLGVTVGWLFQLVEPNIQPLIYPSPDINLLRINQSDCQWRFYHRGQSENIRPFYNGKPAFRGEFPHMVAVGWTSREPKSYDIHKQVVEEFLSYRTTTHPSNAGLQIKYFCGGSLISRKFVLTAAHCGNLDGKEPDTVRLGDIDLDNLEDDMYTEQVDIRRFIKHPQYSFPRKYFDLALIELAWDVRYNRAVCPACLWLEKEPPPELMSSAGFGATMHNEDPSTTLQWGKLSTFDKDQCETRLNLGRRHLPNGLVGDQLCTSGANMDNCQGDSGGPLQTTRVDTSGEPFPMLVGVVSFGTPCGNGSVGVSTRVAPYQHWIEQETGLSMDYFTCVNRPQCFQRKEVYSDFIESNDFRSFRVELVWDSLDPNRIRCGATPLGYHFAATSAFCASMNNGPPQSINASSGDAVKIKSVVIHPEYNPASGENDIALIELARDWYVVGDMTPACLFAENMVKQNRVYFQVYRGDKALVAWTQIEETPTCAGSSHPRKNLFCGKANDNLVPTICRVDYGGPVFHRVSTENTLSMYLVGVTSTLSKGCNENMVATSIYPYREWIKSVIMGAGSE